MSEEPQIENQMPQNVRGGLPFVVRNVQGHSMMPVLPPNTLVIGWKRFGRLETGDVIIFIHNNREKIKRVSQIRGDELFVLGDLVDASTDSRHFGWIPVDSVMAKVVWPRNVRLVVEP